MSRSMVGSPPPKGDALTPPRFAPPGFGAGRCAKTAREKKSAAKRRYAVKRKTMTNSTGWRGLRITRIIHRCFALAPRDRRFLEIPRHPREPRLLFPVGKPAWTRKAWPE